MHCIHTVLIVNNVSNENNINVNKVSNVNTVSNVSAENTMNIISAVSTLDKELDLRETKPTDLKHNIRINPPTEATKLCEAEITVQQLALINCIRDYYMTLEDNSDLTKEEQIGKKRLAKRVKDNQILITFTDKDSRVVICSPDDYNCAA